MKAKSQIWIYISYDVISLRRVQKINKEYKSGEKIDCQRKEGSGRPSHSTSDENVAKVRQLVEEHNYCISYPAIAQNLDFDRSTAYQILIKKLHLKTVCS